MPNPASPARLANNLTIRVGGRQAPILFAGLAQSGFPLPGQYTIVLTLPGDLAPGSYPLTAEIGGVTTPSVSIAVAVVGLVVSQSGFTFTAVQGGGNPAPRTFRIINGNNSPVTYSIAASTFNGGNWLSSSVTTGSIAANGAPVDVDVLVNPSNLAAGDYYGQIRIDAPQAVNSPRFLSIVLNIVAPNVNPGPTVAPTGLLFIGVLNGQNPPPQAARITNVTARPSPFTVTGSAIGGQNFFTFTPASGTANPGQPVAISVQPNLARLPAGVYRGAVTIVFPLDNTTRVIEILFVLTPALNTAAAKDREREADACQPARLLPIFTSLGSNFATVTSWPEAIEVKVADDCGSAIGVGSVEVTFSNGDPPLNLTPVRDGQWSSTWTPRNARNAALRITATARQPDRNLTGTTEIGGNARANEGVPTINANGIVSSGSYFAGAAPSPGEIVSVFGSRLADGFEAAGSLPLPTRLQNTQLLLGERTVPLVFTSDGQVNAVLPYDLPIGSSQQLRIRRGNVVSVPEAVAIQPAQPAVFTTSGNGMGQGHVYVIPEPGVQILADASYRAVAGDVLVIYCTGLGAVTPPASAGSASPPGVLNRASGEVTLTIGGQRANVVFAGLTPGSTGLYQINATVPSGVPPSDEAPVVISVGGVPGPPVTMAVRE